jgi:hypothetical protein
MISSTMDTLKECEKKTADASRLAALHRIVKENIDTLVLAFESAGFVSEGWDRKGTIDWHLKCIECLRGDWMAFYKYKCAAFFSAQMDQIVPPSPLAGTACASDQPSVILGGKAAMWMASVKKRDPDTAVQIAVSIQSSKKGMVRPDAKIVKESTIKAFCKLTAPIPVNKISWADIEDDDEDLPDVVRWMTIQSLRETTRKIFEGKTFSLELSEQMHMPSTSAVYTRTVAQGGMVGEMLSDPEVLALLKELPEALLVVELEKQRYKVDDTELRIAFAKLMELCWRKAEEEDDFATLVGLPEALKVRVITKGPPYRNFVLKCLQRFMWREVRKLPCARLVGEFISEEYLCKQVGPLRPDEEYVSVDYSDATNEIESFVSVTIIDEVCRCVGLSAKRTEIAKKNLVGHLLIDPRSKRRAVRQTRGQLMGSLLSFPILCIANIDICNGTQEEERGRKLDFRLAGKAGPAFCVNGDDAVLRGVRSRAIWQRRCLRYGMKPSPGKVHASRKFVNMNSTHFDVSSHATQPIAAKISTQIIVAPDGEASFNINVTKEVEAVELFLKRRKYVNLGLLKGYKRSEVKAAVADVGLSDSIGAIARWLVESSPPSAREWVLKKYLNRHWSELSKTSLPWFLPEHLGGLGIPRPASAIGQKNLANDMRFAAAVYRRPLPRRPISREWKMMEKAQRAMEGAKVVPHIVLGGDPEAQFGLRSLFIYDVFLKSKGLKSLFKAQDDGEAENLYTKYLRRAEKYVKAGRKLMAKVQPFSPDALPNKPLYEEVYLTADAIHSSVEPEQWLDRPFPDPGSDSIEW